MLSFPGWPLTCGLALAAMAQASTDMRSNTAPPSLARELDPDLGRATANASLETGDPAGAIRHSSKTQHTAKANR